jgi:phospholipid/cholesterol/gamma-HCH transport system substrate-binding protein
VKLSKEFKIGIVVVCAIAAFIWGISFLKGTNLFSSKSYLYAVYPRVDNLNASNPVLVNGYKVGQIKEIKLVSRDSQQVVMVKFLLTEDVQIPKRSVARVVSADLLGNKAVEIVFSREKEFVKSGDTLVAETERGLKESFNKQIAPLQARADHLLGNIDSLITLSNLLLNSRTRDNIDQSFESMRKAITSFERTAYKLDDMMTTEKPKFSAIMTNLNGITGNLNKSEAKIKNILDNFSNLSDSLSKSQLRSAITNADNTLRELNTLMAGINAGTGTLGKLARNDSLYNNLNKSAENLDKLLQDLREHPKRYVRFSVFGGKK